MKKQKETTGFMSVLPEIFGRNQSYPDDLIGATIVRFGTDPSLSLDGGGLIIEYLPVDTVIVKRVVFAFCETGMWVDSLEGSGLV